jgi:hypothetical protein
MDQSTKGIARVTTPATPTVLVAMWRDGFETDRNHNRHNSYCLSGNHRMMRARSAAARSGVLGIQ